MQPAPFPIRVATLLFGCVLLVSLLSGDRLCGQSPAALAQRPPMGWNSWDSYGLTIDEQQFRDNVAVQADKLKSFGWSYSVIDEGWFLRNPEERPHPERLQFAIDDFGRYIPVPSRFPSALQGETNQGFRALAQWVHARGLLFGIHIVRGIPRESVARNLPVEDSAFHAADAADRSDACPWDPTSWGVQDNDAGQAWYDALLRQYASWGVDLLKVDCIADHPYKVSEIRQIHLAIQRSGRPMVLSLSPGPTALAHAAEVASLSQMWRISDDVWDVWRSDAPWPRSVYSQFDTTALWAPYAQPGHWPDADMLPLGELRPHPDVGPGPRHTRLTPDEQRSMLSLWAMARSPLILGANLTLLDASTLALLTNRNILRIDQQARSSQELRREGSLVIWVAELPGSVTALAFFNRGDTPLPVNQTFASLGYGTRALAYRDAWDTQDSGRAKGFVRSLPPHACAVWLLGPAKQ